MPANTTHPQYQDYADTWETISHMVGGQTTVRRHAGLYVPKLKGQSTEEFAAFVRRACFFNATGRTASSFLGMLLRKRPTFTLPDQLAAFAADCDLAGSALPVYASEVIRHLVLRARGGTLIDWSEAEKRPFFTLYGAGEIINWRVSREGGQFRLTMLALEEEVEEVGADPYAAECVKQWRTFDATPGGVEVRVWRKEKDKGDLVQYGPTKMPERRGQRLMEIPFVLHSPTAGWDVATPVLADVAFINGQHFAQSADLENARHVAGIPTPYAVGFAGEKQKELPLGTSAAWVSDLEFANCGFLEFSGAGLGTLENGLKEKETQMAVLGARALEPKQGDAEAFQTVQLRSSAETVTLSTLADSAQASVIRALQWAAWWEGSQARPQDVPGIEGHFNRDFVSARLDSAALTALLQAFQGGAISFETYFHNLQAGEIYPDGVDLETEQERRAAVVPPAPIKAEV